MVAVLLVGMAGYLTIEVLEKKKQSSESESA
jgi:hypothetical protein